ncbi:MAG: GNAT family N-acetyltransferase [Clostridia bacterium]|nr:GNAT family N-acetyltransferase [Clostridia bacterium]
MSYRIRQATFDDLPVVMPIYDQARAYMRQNGNMDQWTGGYPSEDVIRNDIGLNHLYVCLENDEIVGVFCFFTDNEPTYDRIYDGAWLNDEPYGVIHRIGVTSHRKGVASFCYNYCLPRCKNLRIDTHRDNIPMQRSLAKNGFSYCGIIYLLNGDERLAFQKVSQKAGSLS